LWDIADKGVDFPTIEKLTKRINGGTHGLYDRIEKTEKIYGWLND
jgi:predicted chitinase